MNAEIIAVGSEMLTPEKIDTNSLYLTDQLNNLGIEVVQKTIVGDDRERLRATIAGAMNRSEIVILTGGLGPTEDDLTREATAGALGRELSYHPEISDEIAARFKRMNRPMADNNKRQAMVIEGAEVLPNDRGSAPGQWIQISNSNGSGLTMMLLPGPPKELKAMFEKQCLPRLHKVVPPLVIRTLCLRVAGMAESDVDHQIAPIYTKYANPVTTILAGPSDIQIHLRCRCETEAEAQKLLQEVGGQIENVLGDRIYTRTGEELEDAVGTLLKERKATVCTAESCTGGLLAQRLTARSGSSDTFLGSIVSYAPDLKTYFLGVDPRSILLDGAVSESVARQMAVGVRHRITATYGISITGFAGPEGGTEANPVGTVYIGIASETDCEVKRFQFLGDRERVRALAAQTALDMLRRRLLRE
jgi:nicotinamide-nucleotide amidase